MKHLLPAFTLIAALLLLPACVSYTPKGPLLLYGYYTIKGKSMEPTLKEPTVVLVKPLPYKTIESGDIIVMNYRDKLVVHRALKKWGGTWLTQGDGLRSPDIIKANILNYRGTVYIENDTIRRDDTLQGVLHATDTQR